jgi:hypothetical protein
LSYKPTSVQFYCSVNTTKDKGDVGVALVIADLVKNGFKVALPLSDHLPFDLIAINTAGKLFRLSVKHRHVNARGCVEVSTRSVYSNSKGHHSGYIDKNWLDGIALYCPDTAKIYYVPVADLSDKHSVNLRVTKARQQEHRSIPATNYESLELWR